MNMLVKIWNRLAERRSGSDEGLLLGTRVVDGQITRKRFRLSQRTRTKHVVIIGKTGTGKTSLIKSMLEQDIQNGNGFLCIDLHGDLTPFILGRIAERERQSRTDLSSRTVIVNPADPSRAVGINIVEASHRSLPVLISEVVAIFRQRWSLDHFGARTEELLRNSLWVLAENGMALTDLAPLLTNLAFRAALVQRVQNEEIKAYFRERYEQLSEPMQVIVREAILNKVTAFTVDPAVRHIVGQRRSTLDLADALDQRLWVVLSLQKGRLGDNAEILAALILAKLKNAIFARKRRTLFSIYADELQNLVSSGDTFESLLAEARKFGVSVVTANQHLQQYPIRVRAALFSAGTTVFFRSSPEDVPRITTALDGPQSIERLLKELPNQHFLLRTGNEHVVELTAPNVVAAAQSTSSLTERASRFWARSREAIESEIREGTAPKDSGREPLEQWK